MSGVEGASKGSDKAEPGENFERKSEEKNKKEEANYDHFELVGTSSVPGVEIEEYISNKTGVRVFVGDVNSPLVCGFFTFATEAHDNDGLPHTLEHLIFMGSKDYPYKGVLDILANRCLSQGTNAWTATDHTTYTVTTAGVEGFLNILPVYVDHILRPTLEDDAFTTEVHHITHEGTNSGVVYSEMQSRENTAPSILRREVASHLYPGDSGYKYETGGMLADLRKTSNEKVKAYHKQFYRWSNLNLIVTGKFNKNDILSAVAAIEKKHLDENNNNICKGDYKRPWTDEKNFTKLEKPVVSTVKFPSDDEDSGRVAIGWRGPEWKNFLERETVEILGTYLTDSNLSPLEKLLVEIDEPFCSNVEYSAENYKATCFYIECDDVPYCKYQDEEGEEQQKDGSGGGICDNSKKSNNSSSSADKKAREETTKCCQGDECSLTIETKREDKINKIGAEVHKIIKKVYDEGLDMNRLNVLLRRERLQYLRSLETAPHDSVVEIINEYCINGDTFEELSKLLELKKIYDILEEKDADYWKAALKTYFIDAPCVEVRCVPCKEKAKELQSNETQLQKKQQLELGETKLRDIKITLDNIKEKQKEKAPQEVLDSVPFADVQKLSLLNFPVITNFDTPNSNNNLKSHPSHRVHHDHRYFTSDKGDAKREAESGSKSKSQTSTTVASSGGVSSASSANEKNQTHLSFDNVSFLMQLNDIPSDFVQIKLMARTPDTFSNHQKSLLLLLSELFFECPLGGNRESSISFSHDVNLPKSTDEQKKEGNDDKNENSINNIYMSHESLTEKLLHATTGYAASLGLNGGAFRPGIYHDFLCLSVTCGVSTYYEAVSLLLDTCADMKITEERFMVQMKILKNSISKKKRNARFLLDQIECGMRYRQDCIINQCNLSRQEELLKGIQCNISNNKNDEKQGEEKTKEKPKKTEKKKGSEGGTRGVECVPEDEEEEEEQSVEEIIEELQSIYDEIFQDKNLIVHISADVTKLPEKWLSPWQLFSTKLSKKPKKNNVLSNTLPSAASSSSSSSAAASVHVGGEGGGNAFSSVKRCLNIKQGYDYCISEDGQTCIGNSVLCGLASTDAAYLSLTVKAAEGFLHDDVAALMVLSEYFSMMEGPLYRNIRGAGYAYGCGLRYIPYTGELNLRISPATDVCSALYAALIDFQKFSGGAAGGGGRSDAEEKRRRSLNTNNNNNTRRELDGNDNESFECSNSFSSSFSFSFSSSFFDKSELECAKSSTLYSIISKEETVADYAFQTFFNVFKNVPYDYNRILLNKVQAITINDVLNVACKYLSGFCSFKFDSFCLKDGKSLCVVANTKKIEGISSGILMCGMIDNIRVIKPKIFFKCLRLQTHLEDIQTEEEDYDEEEDDEEDDDEHEGEGLNDGDDDD